jgi:predicted nuclease with TOPRIM domain
VQVLRAQKELANRLQQEEIVNQRDSSKALVKSACDEIKSLNDTQAAIQRNKGALEAEHNCLLQELNRVNQAIDTADHDLSQIPSAITRLEGEKQKHARQAYQLHKSLQQIPSSSESDNQVIQEANQIRLRAIKVIQEALVLL